MKDIYDIVAESSKRPGESFALATLVQAEGSSYRRPGARLLICADGYTVGSLSGGCIEQEIAVRARSVLESGEPVIIDFDTRQRFGCHGRIDIVIEKLTERFLADIGAELEARRSCVISTTANGSHLDSYSVGQSGGLGWQEDQKHSRFRYGPFVQVVDPRLQLLICGEGPDGVPMTKLCELLGWKAVAVSEVHSLGFEVDSWTAAIVKSHNFGRDFAMLARLLPLNLPYVGLIGPKKRRDQLLNDLLEIGVWIDARFFAPAGLDLNAETPEEIALSVISEIQRVFAKGSGQSLRDRKLPIHGAAEPPRSRHGPGWQPSAL